MKLFKKRTQKSGYSNMTEPVSDLDPKRISALKSSKHYGELDPKVISAIKFASARSISKQDETDSKTVELSPSPSQLSKSVAKLMFTGIGDSSGCGSAGSPAGFTISETITACTPPENDMPSSTIKKRLFASGSDNDARSKESASSPDASMSKKKNNTETRNKAKGSGAPKPPIAPPKTPDTFFQGRNRKHFQTHMNDLVSQVLPDHLNTFEADIQDQHSDDDNSDQKKDTNKAQQNQLQQIAQHGPKDTIGKGLKNILPVTRSRTNDINLKCSSDLDKTFDPEIISVSSAITEPSYHDRPSSRRNNNQSWRKWRKIREDFSSTCRQHDFKSSLTFLDMVVDAICATGPTSNTNRKNSPSN